MTDSFSTHAGLEAIPHQIAEIMSRFEELKTSGDNAARSIDNSFSKAGASLVRSLAAAAADGKISLQELASALLDVLSTVFGLGQGGLGGALVGLARDYLGARADGGPVTAGGAYLVGERGPEWFRPGGAGEIVPASPGGVTVNIQMTGDAPERLLRSEAQLAQALARAVSLGSR